MTREIIEENMPDAVSRPSAVRFAAKVFSFLAHPLFVPLYVTYFLLFLHPLLFAGYERFRKLNLVATVFVNLTLLPALTVFLCWRLKFISSIFMKTQKERIIPLAAAMIFYFWCWFVQKNFLEIPALFRQFLLGSFITIIMAWMANIYYKISLHALAVGGLFCFMLLVVFNFEGGSAGYIAAAAGVAGLVCTSRLILHAHRPFEVYSGFILGMLSQVLALWFN
jgi:hypothetical protein